DARDEYGRPRAGRRGVHRLLDGDHGRRPAGNLAGDRSAVRGYAGGEDVLPAAGPVERLRWGPIRLPGDRRPSHTDGASEHRIVHGAGSALPGCGAAQAGCASGPDDALRRSRNERKVKGPRLARPFRSTWGWGRWDVPYIGS